MSHATTVGCVGGGEVGGDCVRLDVREDHMIDDELCGLGPTRAATLLEQPVVRVHHAVHPAVLDGTVNQRTVEMLQRTRRRAARDGLLG